ncbi:MAG: serine kinase [Pseudomonadota bacterium]
MHASCVEWEGRGLLIAGPSGSGKSSLALELMAYGAGLVADDRTFLWDKGALWARAPESLPRAIEGRGFGLLKAELTGQAQIVAAVALPRRNAARMPQYDEISLLSQSIPLLHRPASGPFGAMLLQYLKLGLL